MIDGGTKKQTPPDAAPVLLPGAEQSLDAPRHPLECHLGLGHLSTGIVEVHNTAQKREILGKDGMGQTKQERETRTRGYRMWLFLSLKVFEKKAGPGAYLTFPLGISFSAVQSEREKDKSRETKENRSVIILLISDGVLDS